MYSYSFEIFHSPCKLIFHATTKTFADEIAGIIFQYAKRMEERYSFFVKDSELSSLNNRKKRCVVVSDELAGMLALSAFYYERTSFCFDVAYAGTLHNCYGVSTQEEYQHNLKILLPYAQFACIHLDGNSVHFSNDYTKIDLGGLVKEYAVDQSIILLQKMNISSALVDFGGDIAAYGTHEGAHWNIGIQDPEHPKSNLLQMNLDRAAVCTSGHTKNFYMIGDTKISHILSKGKSTHKQISILAPTAIDAGIWSTSLLVSESLKIPKHIKIVSYI